jgi:predicted protein tyrosine phosphatase
MKKYLFICKNNLTRSKFGAEFLRGYLLAKGINAEVFSRGILFISYLFGRKLRAKDLVGINKIFVMEDYMKEYILKKYKVDNKKIIILEIKDLYGSPFKKSVKELDKHFEKINWDRYL